MNRRRKGHLRTAPASTEDEAREAGQKLLSERNAMRREVAMAERRARYWEQVARQLLDLSLIWWRLRERDLQIIEQLRNEPKKH